MVEMEGGTEKEKHREDEVILLVKVAHPSNPVTLQHNNLAKIRHAQMRA
jgi:hypothetical protein